MRGARPLAALEATLAERAALGAGETVVVGASGGPDSTALCALLVKAAQAAGATVVLAHVAHGVRPGAAQDEAVVLATGAALGARVVATALPPGPADEARLRTERYAALAHTARACGARRVFTAHHAEDQTETVLLALFRGTGPDGLCAMAPERILEPGLTLVRPLLDVEPAELRRYCSARGLAFALDPTNQDPGYRRNAVRAALAELRGSFPRLDAAVARCATILREERAATPRAALRSGLRDLTFERLDAVARALEAGGDGRHFLVGGVELVVESSPKRPSTALRQAQGDNAKPTQSALRQAQGDNAKRSEVTLSLSKGQGDNAKPTQGALRQAQGDNGTCRRRPA